MIYYLIGIKGNGMKALASLLLDEGKIVKGCDLKEASSTLDKRIIQVDLLSSIDKNKEYIYIIGNAFKDNEYTKEIKENYNYYFYSDFIASHFKNKKMISVCGSHGKTLTTKLLAKFNDESYLCGDGEGKLKKGKYLILESCEYKNTFLNYNPYAILCLNIDYDHPDFFLNKEDYISSFKKFFSKALYVVVNGDDENIISIKEERFISFGIKKENKIRFQYEIKKNYSICSIFNEKYYLPFLSLPFIYNFVGALIITKLISSENRIQEKINSFVFPKGRMEIKEKGGNTFILDYAHHPLQIKTTFNEIRKRYPSKSIIAFFEGHTLSRMKIFKEEFKKSLSLFSKTYMLPLYFSVREKENSDEEKELLTFFNYEKITEERIYSYDFKNGNIYVFLGAGNIINIFNKIT